MKKQIAKKLRQLANEEMKKMYRSDVEVLNGHAKYLIHKKPVLLPLFAWKWIIKKVIYR